MAEPQIDLVQLARLAGLQLRAEDEPRLRAQLGRVLEYVAQLEQLEIDDESAAEAAGEPIALRPDEIQPHFTLDEALSVAVERDGEFFRVAPVMKERSA